MTKSLARMRASSKTRHPEPVVGVYLGAVLYGIQIDDTMRTIAAGRFCATPHYVTLKLRLEQVILIPREFADDSCLKSLSQDHEAKHADADAQALAGARPAFEAALLAAVGQARAQASATRVAALATLTADIQLSVNQIIDDVTAVRERHAAEVDSAAELEHLNTACRGRAAQLSADPVLSQ